MSDEGGISVFDELPKIGKEVFVGNECNNIFSPHGNAFLVKIMNEFHWNCSFCGMKEITHWRPIPEKRPDFGKLNIGDKLIIDIMSNDSKGSKVIEYFGYFQGISESNMLNISINTYSFIGDCISVSRVKKITRINMIEKTFEEI